MAGIMINITCVKQTAVLVLFRCLLGNGSSGRGRGFFAFALNEFDVNEFVTSHRSAWRFASASACLAPSRDTNASLRARIVCIIASPISYLLQQQQSGNWLTSAVWNHSGCQPATLEPRVAL